MERLLRTFLRSWSVWMQNLHGLAVLLNPFGRRVLSEPARERGTMRREIVTRDSMWGSQFGKWSKIRDLEDTHLANIIRYLHENFPEDSPWLNAMIEEARIRGLHKEFILRSYIPFKDPDGRWRLWNNEKFTSEIVG